MPVNEKNGSGKLLEQGWSRMQGILDQEMPQVSKRRLGLWVPVSVLSIAALIVAIIYMSGEKEAKTAPIEQTNPYTSFAQTMSDVNSEETAVIHNSEFDPNANEGLSAEGSLGEPALNSDVPGSINNVSDHDAKEHQLEDIPSSELSESQKLSQHARDTENQIQTSSKMSAVDYTSDENNTDISANYTKLNDRTAAKSEPSAEIGISGVSQSNNSGKETSDVDNNTTNDSSINSDSDVAYVDGIAPAKLNNSVALVMSETTVMNRVMVPSKPVNAVDVTLLDQAPLAMPIIPVAVNVKPRIGMDAFFAPHFAAPVQMQGYEFGALATLSFGRKWKIMTGASIGHYNKSGVLQFGGLSQDLSVEALVVPTIPDTPVINYPGSDPEVAYDLIGYDTVQLLTEVFNYLHIPVLGQYRVANFLSVIGGVKFSYLINAPTSRELNAIPQFGTSTGTSDLKNSRNFLAEENILHSWDVAPVVGLAFDVGGRFAFDIQYQHGLIAYIDRPAEGDRSDYQRTLSIGLRYSFF